MKPCSAYLGLYWGPRFATLEDATALCVSGFRLLEEAGFRDYYLKGRSRTQAHQLRISPTNESVKELLGRGRNRRDTDREVIAELGYFLSLWSGGPVAEAYSLSIQVGATSEYVKNSFVLDLPASGPFALSGNEGRYQALQKAMSGIFYPDSSTVTFNL